MRPLVIVAVFLLGIGGSSESLDTAYAHFESGAYQESLRYFREALRNYPDQAPNIYYNMGQCMTKLDSGQKALEYYHLALRQSPSEIASLAYNNIGIQLVAQSDFQEALKAFRNAVVQDPDNETARYNYELLKRKLDTQAQAQEENKPDPETEPEEQQDEEDSNPPGQSNANTPPPLPVGEYQELIDKLKRRNRNNNSNEDQAMPQSLDTISLDKAQQLLESMREDEVQFLQQLRKSPVSPAKKDGKPDW